MSEEFITKEDMFFAYRKVKVDVFYSGHYSAERIIAYEESLQENLECLRKKLLFQDTAIP